MLCLKKFDFRFRQSIALYLSDTAYSIALPYSIAELCNIMEWQMPHTRHDQANYVALPFTLPFTTKSTRTHQQKKNEVGLVWFCKQRSFKLDF